MDLIIPFHSDLKCCNDSSAFCMLVISVYLLLSSTCDSCIMELETVHRGQKNGFDTADKRTSQLTTNDQISVFLVTVAEMLTRRPTSRDSLWQRCRGEADGNEIVLICMAQDAPLLQNSYWSKELPLSLGAPCHLRRQNNYDSWCGRESNCFHMWTK